MIAAVLIIWVSFNMLFPTIKYINSWEDAKLVLLGRDSILSIDRSGKLYRLSFNKTELSNTIKEIVNDSKVLFSYETRGAPKTEIVVACNCTKTQIQNLTKFFYRSFFNDRIVHINFIPTNLEKSINMPSDLLLIWGYRDLSPYYNIIERYMKTGRGVIEVSDLNLATIDDGHKRIFGIDVCPSCSISSLQDNYFIEPSSTNEQKYQLFKIFYHFPMRVDAPTSTDSVPTEPSVPICISQNLWEGYFKFRETYYKFWICNNTHVYFDSDNNELADISVKVRDYFNISIYNFSLSYIVNSSIFVSFKEDYFFKDLNKGFSKIALFSPQSQRLLLSAGKYTDNTEIPSLVVNTSLSKAVWIANISRNGVENMNDDEKLLLLSSIIYASNKEFYSKVFFKRATMVQYINFDNYDMLDLYSFGLGFSYPY